MPPKKKEEEDPDALKVSGTAPHIILHSPRGISTYRISIPPRTSFG